MNAQTNAMPHVDPEPSPVLGYSPAAYAAMTSLSLSTVRRRLRAGELPMVRVGRRVMIAGAAILHVLDVPALTAIDERIQRMGAKLRAAETVAQRTTEESPEVQAVITEARRELAEIDATLQAHRRALRAADLAAKEAP